MKITKQQLKQLVQEELKILNEFDWTGPGSEEWSEETREAFARLAAKEAAEKEAAAEADVATYGRGGGMIGKGRVSQSQFKLLVDKIDGLHALILDKLVNVQG